MSIDVIVIGNAVRHELERIGEHHSCIFASAVLLEVLQRNTVPNAFPLAVKLVLFNPGCAKRIKSGVQFPKDEPTQMQWAAEGCITLSIGSDAAPALASAWNGHLIVVVPNYFEEKHLACDLTITQVNNATFEIDCSHQFLRVGDDFAKGRKPFPANINGCLLFYQAMPDNVSYQQATVWTNRERIVSTADKIIKSLS